MRKTTLCVALLVTSLALSGPARATIDLVTLPEREKVQLTIYNSADLTLVREVRLLTLKRGTNRLAFSWADTLIDPTSLHLRAIDRPDAVQLLDVSYPPNVNTTGVWTVESEIDGEVPVEITFFTSGIGWRAFYMATLSADEKTMDLSGYVRVANGSGEDYAGAQTRLIVGKIHLLDEIATLARRPAPYGVPGIVRRATRIGGELAAGLLMDALKESEKLARAPAEKRIIKEGLSEYFLYTIEGTETIPNGWSKRLPSFHADAVPVVNLYKYEEERYGPSVVRFLLFYNDEQHKLGDTPLPGGLVKVFRTVDDANHLSYEGADNTKYIPVDQKAELNLGATARVLVKPTLMEMHQENFSFDRKGNIDGFERVETWKVEIKNRREVPVRVDVTRNLKHQYWSAQSDREYVKDDMDTIKFTVGLDPHEAASFSYTVRYFEGERRQKK